MRKNMPGCDCCNVCLTPCGPPVAPQPSDTIAPRGIDLVLQDLPSQLYVAYIFNANLGFTVPSLGVIIENLDILEGTYTIERNPIACPQELTIPLDISRLRYSFYGIESSVQWCPVPPFVPYTLDSIDIVSSLARLSIGFNGVASFAIGFHVVLNFSSIFGSDSVPFRISWGLDIGWPRCDTGPLVRNLTSVSNIDVMVVPTNCPSYPPPLDDNSYYEWIF